MIRFGLLLVVSVCAFSCKKDKPSEKQPVFPRELVLRETADRVILPAYDSLVMQTAALQNAVTQFNASPNTASLSSLRSQLKKTWESWLAAGTFEFGPAETILLRSNINTFPTDTAQIKSNISGGSWDLATASNLDAKGFPALDFLLNSGSDQHVLTRFSDPEAKNYLADVASDAHSHASQVKNEWSSGSYHSTFSNSGGTSAGSPFSLLINQLNFDLEITKTNRIAIPLGLKTLGTPLPEKTEVYFGGYSAHMATLHLAALENTFLVKDGPGLYEYLNGIDAKYNNQPLADAIADQFVKAKTAMAAVPDPLSATVISNPAVVETAYAEIQKLVVLMKTDMPSATGIMITYQDNDGD